MKRADIYLRRGKIFTVGMKGRGGIFYEDSSPLMADLENVEAVTEAIQGALRASEIPSPIPADLRALRSALPALAGVKTDSTFARGAHLCIVRESDDLQYDLLRGELQGGSAWKATLTRTLAPGATPAELTQAILAILQSDE